MKGGEGDATSDTDDNDVVGNRRLFRHQQHIAYLYRGDDLKELNLYEYSALIVIQPERKNKTKKCPVVDENAPIKGRKPCATFPFSKNAPANLRENFVQKLRAMPLTPILAGRAPPSKQFSTAFMEYYLTLLVPWDESMKGPPVPPTEAAFRQWLEELVTPDTPLDSVQWHRAQIFLRSAAKPTPKFVSKLKDRHRRRGHTEWNGFPDDIPDRAADGLPDNDSSKRRSTQSQQEIAQTAQTELKLLRDLAKAGADRECSFDENRSALIATMCNTPTPTTANDVILNTTNSTTSNLESAVDQARTSTLAARSARTLPELVQDVLDAAEHARHRVSEAVQQLTVQISDRRQRVMSAQHDNTAEPASAAVGGLPQESALLPHENSAPHVHHTFKSPVDFEAIWSRKENSTLSPEQKKVVQIIIQYVADLVAFEADPTPTKSAPAPPALLVHGRGGLGKTKIIKTLVHELGPAMFKLTAPTGSSAKALGGSTLHSAFMIRNETGVNINTLSSDDIAKLKGAFDTCKVVVVDELSMVGTRNFHAILSRLRDIGDPSHHFGGFAVVFLGDFFQMNPVKDTSLLKPLIDSCLSPSNICRTTTSKKSTTTASAQRLAKSIDRQNEQVAAALRTLVRIELRPHDNQRSRDDPDMNFLQTALRNTSVDFPIDDVVLNLLRSRTLSISTAQRACHTPGQSSWRDGIMVLSNLTRVALNRVFVTAFGNENGLPIFQFQKKILGDCSPELRRAFHNAYPCRLTTRLTIGTPVFITKNQSPADLGVTNGTIGKVEGFVYKNPDDRTAFDAAVQSFFRDRSCTDANDDDASIITIPFPDRILVRVAGEDLAGLAILATSEGDNEPGDDVIIPISAHNDKIKLNGVTVTIQEHELEPAFALTNYKIQSQTRANMALDLVKAPGRKSQLCLRALYVGLTRPTSFNGIHILPDNSGAPPNLDHLRKLTFDPYLRVFEQAYDDAGKISNERVNAFAATGILEEHNKGRSNRGNQRRFQSQGASFSSSSNAAQARAMKKKRRMLGIPNPHRDDVPHEVAALAPSQGASATDASQQGWKQKKRRTQRVPHPRPLQEKSTTDTRCTKNISQSKKRKGSTTHDLQNQGPSSSAPTEHQVRAQRWAGADVPGERVTFTIRGNQYRWTNSCPIDATLFAVGNAAARSSAFRTMLEVHAQKVAAYVRALWSLMGVANNDAQLRQLRHEAAFDMITRQLQADERRIESHRVVHLSGTHRKIISTYGGITDWINLALPNRPFTCATHYEDFTCNSTILDIIRQRANLDSTDLRHTNNQIAYKHSLVAENGHLQRSNELLNSWNNQFAMIRCGQTLDTPVNIVNSAVAISAKQVVDDMVTSCEHEAIELGEDRLNTHPKGVVYVENHTSGIQYYTCGASCQCNTKLITFPPLLVLFTQGAQPGHLWLEQPLEVTLDAPMQATSQTSRERYSLAAIIQHLPGHWTASFHDERTGEWFYHDGLQNRGYPQRCNDQASTIQSNADTVRLVYVKL